jgi:hypothetical protein
MLLEALNLDFSFNYMWGIPNVIFSKAYKMIEFGRIIAKKHLKERV